MSGSVSVPLIMSDAGPQPTPATTLNSTIIAGAKDLAPGLTVLPGGLIDDMSGTATGAAIVLDLARVDAVNSVTPYGANAFILAQQGAMFGIPQGAPTNTSVYVVFSSSSTGLVIPAGFVVSDGSAQYATQSSAVIQSTGSSLPIYAVASSSGSWPVPANTVTQVISQLAPTYMVTVTNPQAGTPGQSAESISSYRSRIFQAFSAAGQGTADYIRTQLLTIPGVVPRLVSVLQTASGWEVICGGGNPQNVAFAIYESVLNLSGIVGSQINPSRNIVATIISGPNTYNVTFVNPPAQTVTCSVSWNTNMANFTNALQVNALAAQALVAYFNSITVGQPINELQMISTFESAVASVLPQQNISVLNFTVSINGTQTNPVAGTYLIPGDIESYFTCAPNGVTVTQA